MEHFGFFLGEVSISRNYRFEEPKFDYPEDFLLDPRPELACDPASFEFDDRGYNEDGTDFVPGMIEPQAFLIF